MKQLLILAYMLLACNTTPKEDKQILNIGTSYYEFVRQIKTNSYVDALIQQGNKEFPLIIFAPSLGGNISMYTYYAEQLALSDYIVVGVNHLYESEYVINKNDSLFQANLFFHDSLKTLEIPSQISAEGYRAANGLWQETLGDDLIFCLDQITVLNERQFEHKIDLEKVGVWGHSIGGAAAVFAAYKDSRFDAVLDLDGTPPSITLNEGINQPFMFIKDLTDYVNHVGYQKLYARRNNSCTKIQAPAYRVLILETNHNSFLDIHYHSIDDPEEKEKSFSPA